MAKRLVIAVLLLLCNHSLLAWDRTGHRLTTELAYSLINSATREYFLTILTHHPRYQQDFIAVMPQGVRRGSLALRQNWLLAQAAFWPDLARSLPNEERVRYNRPDWHFIDGAWLRDEATMQGNVYINRRPFPNIKGVSAESIQDESTASNIVLALDYNSAILLDVTANASTKAIALCWILHLIGDIHQPLHTGSLYSISLPDGDSGGNGIETGSVSLHRRWDNAVFARESGKNLESVRKLTAELQAESRLGASNNWSIWLQESREILRSFSVYDARIRQEVEKSDLTRRPLQAITLDESYVEEMRRISLRRIALAGLRLANWLNTYGPQPTSQ